MGLSTDVKDGQTFKSGILLKIQEIALQAVKSKIIWTECLCSTAILPPTMSAKTMTIKTKPIVDVVKSSTKLFKLSLAYDLFITAPIRCTRGGFQSCASFYSLKDEGGEGDPYPMMPWMHWEAIPWCNGGRGFPLLLEKIYTMRNSGVKIQNTSHVALNELMLLNVYEICPSTKCYSRPNTFFTVT